MTLVHLSSGLVVLKNLFSSTDLPLCPSILPCTYNYLKLLNRSPLQKHFRNQNYFIEYLSLLLSVWVRIQTALIHYECLAYKKSPLCIRDWVGFVHFTVNMCRNVTAKFLVQNKNKSYLAPTSHRSILTLDLDISVQAGQKWIQQRNIRLWVVCS